MHQVVVQHHIGGRETVQPPNRDEIRIPRSGANEINDALGRKNLVAKALSLKRFGKRTPFMGVLLRDGLQAVPYVHLWARRTSSRISPAPSFNS